MRRRLVLATLVVVLFGASLSVAGATVRADCDTGPVLCISPSAGDASTEMQLVATEATNLSASGSYSEADPDNATGVRLLYLPSNADPSSVTSATKWKPCVINFHQKADYKKPAGDGLIHETGSMTTYSTCPSYAVSSTQAEVTIRDDGLPVVSTVHQAQDKTTKANTIDGISSSTAQNVPLLTLPTDYHAYGSDIVWDFDINLKYTKYGSGPTNLCAQEEALYGNPVTPDYGENCAAP